jgi:hypothetical protein
VLVLPAKVGHVDLRYAMAADVERLARTVGGQPTDEAIVGWHLVVVAAGDEDAVHALGQRYGAPFVTGVLTAFDGRCAASRSGHPHKLGWRGADEDMRPSLACHLVEALIAWGLVSEGVVFGR